MCAACRGHPSDPCLPENRAALENVRPTQVQVRVPLSEAKWFTPVLRTKEGHASLKGGRQGECQPGPFSTRPATRSEIICCPTPTPSLTTPSVKTTFKVEQLCAALLVLSYQTNSCTCGMPQDALRIPQPMHEDRRSTRREDSRDHLCGGPKERIQLETNNAAPWEWRRICFTSKDDFNQADPDTSDYFRRTSSGMVRLLRAEQESTYLADELFEGERNVDYLSLITAPLSRKYYSIMYDKTRVLRSSNQAGVTHNFKMWHPMRKNIVYKGSRPVRTWSTQPYLSKEEQAWAIIMSWTSSESTE